MTVVGWVLVSGFVVFLVGASGWRMAYEQPMEQALVAMHEDRGRLRWIHWWMVPAMFLTSAGLVGLAVATGDALVGLAAGLFVVGAVPWLLALLFRLSVGEWAAERTVETGAVPDVYPPLARWVGLGHAVHMMSAYVAASVLGAAVLTTDLEASWLGWGLVGWGVLWAALLLSPARGAAYPPVIAHVATFALGLALVL